MSRAWYKGTSSWKGATLEFADQVVQDRVAPKAGALQFPQGPRQSRATTHALGPYHAARHWANLQESLHKIFRRQGRVSPPEGQVPTSGNHKPTGTRQCRPVHCWLII